jgi:hypothetical protein
MPDAWSVYLATDDIGATLATAKDHAAEIVVPAMAVGELGTMAFLADPTGAGIGLRQPGTHGGFATFGEQAHRAGSNCTLVTTTRPSRSIATCSASIPPV